MLVIWTFDQLLFGQKDAPSILGIGVDQCVEKWKKHAGRMERDGSVGSPMDSQSKIAPHVIADTSRVLKRPYVDDLMSGPPLPSYIIHALKRCQDCHWCDKCFEDCTKPEKVHRELCRLYRDDPLPPLKECQDCKLCAKCKQWANLVRPDQYGGVSLTADEWERYMGWLGSEATQYLPILARAILEVLQFSSFGVKSIDSNLRVVRQVHENFYPPVEESNKWYTPKPDSADVRREGLRVKQSQPDCFEDESLEVQTRDQAPFLVQMGKEFFAPEDTLFQDRVGIKTRYLEVSKVIGFPPDSPRSREPWAPCPTGACGCGHG